MEGMRFWMFCFLMFFRFFSTFFGGSVIIIHLIYIIVCIYVLVAFPGKSRFNLAWGWEQNQAGHLWLHCSTGSSFTDTDLQ